YKGAKVQPWDWARKNADGPGLGHYECTAIKYIVRFRKKEGLKDLYKAMHYTEKALFCFRAGEYENECTASLARIRQFNMLNACDRWQSEAVIMLVRWRTEEDLFEVKKIIEELIQVQKDGGVVASVAPEEFKAITQPAVDAVAA